MDARRADGLWPSSTPLDTPYCTGLVDETTRFSWSFSFAFFFLRSFSGHAILCLCCAWAYAKGWPWIPSSIASAPHVLLLYALPVATSGLAASSAADLQLSSTPLDTLRLRHTPLLFSCGERYSELEIKPRKIIEYSSFSHSIFYRYDFMQANINLICILQYNA
jgi:hypothetical protein